MCQVAHVTDRDLGLKAFIRQLETARKVEVVVGIQANAMHKGESVAFYAACNEYGTKSIPERSFMRSSFDESIGAIKSDMDQQAGAVMDGRKDIRSALGTIGLKHQARIKSKISSNIRPENADSTIARKKSSATLIDTGTMRNSVHYVVRGKS